MKRIKGVGWYKTNKSNWMKWIKIIVGDEKINGLDGMVWKELKGLDGMKRIKGIGWDEKGLNMMK